MPDFVVFKRVIKFTEIVDFAPQIVHPNFMLLKFALFVKKKATCMFYFPTESTRLAKSDIKTKVKSKTESTVLAKID